MFSKNAFFLVTKCIGLSVVNTLKYVSISNQECKVRPVIININSNELYFYRYSILVDKWTSSCKNINDPYAEICLPHVV